MFARTFIDRPVMAWVISIVIVLFGLAALSRLPGAKVENAVLVPDSAVVVDGAGKVVYTLDAENKVVVNPVKTGPLTGGLRVIVSGLKPTDRVVVRGVQRVQAGVPVEPEQGTIAPDAK